MKAFDLMQGIYKSPVIVSTGIKLPIVYVCLCLKSKKIAIVEESLRTLEMKSNRTKRKSLSTDMKQLFFHRSFSPCSSSGIDLCTPGDVCGPYATCSMSGRNRVCTCDKGFEMSNGYCVGT